jgi:hypothetical protein
MCSENISRYTQRTFSYFFSTFSSGFSNYFNRYYDYKTFLELINLDISKNFKIFINIFNIFNIEYKSFNFIYKKLQKYKKKNPNRQFMSH